MTASNTANEIHTIVFASAARTVLLRASALLSCRGDGTVRTEKMSRSGFGLTPPESLTAANVLREPSEDFAASRNHAGTSTMQKKSLSCHCARGTVAGETQWPAKASSRPMTRIENPSGAPRTSRA